MAVFQFGSNKSGNTVGHTLDTRSEFEGVLGLKADPKSRNKVFKTNFFSGFLKFDLFLSQNVQNYKDHFKIIDLVNFYRPLQ